MLIKQPVPSLPKKSVFYLFAFFFLSGLCACSEGAPLPGDVATVNGQGISFRELESRRAVLFAGTSPKTPVLDDAILREQYRYILGKMIEEAVICQFMEGRGTDLEEGALEAEEKRIREDYPEGSFEEMLSEQGLTLEEWRESTYRRLLIDLFMLQVLRPEISITADEAQQYYLEHSEDFIIPERWHFLQIVGPDKRDVELARDSLLAGKEPSAAQKEFLVVIHDIRMGSDLLPAELLTQLTPLQKQQASKTVKGDGEHRVLVLLDRTPATVLDAAEISKRIEQALVEEKMQNVYAAWMRKRLGKQTIRIVPALERQAGQEPDALPALSDNMSSGQGAGAQEGTPGSGHETRTRPE